jgi:ELWxxDGT repeat protein
VADSDVFAVRWTGQIKIDQAGLYTFFLQSDDGSRLYIDNQLVIDHGGLHGFSEKSGTFNFTETGFHDIRVEMFENFGSAGVKLLWDPPSLAQGKQVIPSSVLFRDARDVINVATDRDVELSGFTGPVTAASAGDVTPVVGTGILGEYFVQPSLEALKFKGNQVVQVGDSNSLDLARTLTLEARFRVDAFGNQWMPLVQKSDGSGLLGRNYALFVNQNGYVQLSVSDGTTSQFVSTALGSIHTGQWYDVAGVVDRNAGKMRIFLDGVQVAEVAISTTSSVTNDKPLLFGDTLEASASFSSFTGLIDQVALWNTVRNATQIQSDRVDVLAGTETGLAGLWRFNEHDGDVAKDATANANNGVLGAGVVARAPDRVQGQLREIPDFTGLTPTHTRTDAVISFSDDGGFDGFADLTDLFAARWTGQIFIQTGGNVSFGFIANDAARLFIDGGLVAELKGLNDFGTALGTLHLDAGFHDIRLEYIDNIGPGLLALGWNLSGSTNFSDLELIPASAFVRTDATAGNATLRGAEDLLISDGSSVRLVNGRARADWTNLTAAQIPAFFLGSGSITGLGDINRDGRDDFGVLRSGQLRIYSGGGVPQSPTQLAMITGLPANVSVLAAGDIDGDAVGDILITGSGGSFLIFGGDLPASATLASLLTSHTALTLPGGAWRGIGDFDGNHDVDGDGEGDRFDDLAAAVLVTSDRLNESAQFEHQVVELFLGGQRADLIARFGAANPTPDAVFEPGRARFATPGTLTPDSRLFGTIGSRTDAGLTRSLLALSGPGGDGLAVFDGSHLTAATESDPVLPPSAPVEAYEFELTNPTAPGQTLAPPSGVDLANDANPRARDAFVLEGSTASERLGASQAIGDFNGDSFADFVIQGNAATYVMFGPVQVDDALSMVDEADLIVSADVGRIAARLGDVTGDGLADLVFVRPTTLGNFDIVIIAGGNGGGIDLPRHVDKAWIDAQIAANPSNARVRVRHASGFGYADAGASFNVLNWNDNGFADLAMIRRAPLVTSEQGFIIDGNTLWNGAGTIVSSSASGKLALLTPDTLTPTQLVNEALAVLGSGATTEASHAVQVPQLTAIVAGDVNGDGLDDLLLADSGFMVFPSGGGAGSGTLSVSDPNVGRAYLLTGRTAVASSLNLAAGAEVIVQDFSVGGSLAALGDLNHDGYDDFAIGSTSESRRAGQDDTSREGGLFVFLGKADFGAGAKLLPEAADIIVARDVRDSIPEGRTLNGLLNATAGDFDGDGRMDLAIGEPTRITTVTGTSTILDQDESGRLSVFFDVMSKGHLLALTQASKTVAADFDFDNFGVLSTTPGFDLDGDQIDDLIVGAPGSDVVSSDVVGAAGKAFVIYGASARSNLPPTAIELANRTFTGSGNFLVDNGTGRAEVFKDPPGVTNTRFTLQAGDQDIWYKFTTLGDGMPGNAIRITPGLTDGFIAPIEPGSDTATAGVAQVVGNSLTQHSTIDLATGSLFVGDGFAQSGRLTGWSLFSGNFTDDAGSAADDRFVTPVIMKDMGDGKFQITGIGTARKIAPNIAQSFDFGLVSGSDSVGAGYFLGWKDGSATKDNAGSVSFDFGGDSVRWFGPGQTNAGNMTVGRTLPTVSTFARSYAIQGLVTSGAVLEFDLGRLLGLAGNPDGIASAKLVLDAPTAADPVLAPVVIQDIEHAGGKLFFTAFDSAKGFELWVTDGTVPGTKLVKDLSPGTVSSLPINLTDLGGTLYFTANAVSSGTKLYSSDGTAEHTQEVANITGTPEQFTTQLGTADLTAALAGPTDGVPDVDYTFQLDILRENGDVDTVDITIHRDDFNDNTTTGQLFTQLQAALTAALADDLVGDVSVSNPDATHFVFTANESDIVRLTVRNAPDLGFGSQQASPPSVVTAAAAAPDANQFTEDLAFTIDVETVGGAIATLDLTLNATATTGNATLGDLAGDLQTIVNASLLAHGFTAGAVVVGNDGTHLQLSSAEGGIIALTVHGTDVSKLGFTDGATSVRTVALTAHNTAPATGQLPADLTLHVNVLKATGETSVLTITRTGAATRGVVRGSGGRPARRPGTL